MKLWPQSTGARILLVSFIVIVLTGTLSITILVMSYHKYANRPLFGVRDYESNHRERAASPMVSSVITMGPTQDRLDAFLQVELKIAEALSKRDSKQDREACELFKDAYELSLRKFGNQLPMTQWAHECLAEEYNYAHEYLEAVKQYHSLAEEIAAASKSGVDGLGEDDQKRWFYTKMQEANSLDDQGNHKEAIAIMEKEALPLARKLDEKNPDKPDLFYGTMYEGMAYCHDGQYAKAITCFEATKKLMQERHATNEQQAYNYNWLGYCRFWNGQKAAGLAEYQAGLNLDKNNKEILEQRAFAYENLKQYDLAIKDLNVVIAKARRYEKGDYLKHRAYIHKLSKQYQLAVDDLNEAIAAAEDDAIGYQIARIDIYRDWHKNKEILKYCDEVLAKDRHNDMARVFRADYYRDTRQYEAAVADYTTAIHELVVTNGKPSDMDDESLSYYHGCYAHRADCYDQLGKKELAKKDRKVVAEFKKGEEASE